jgi:hypothetical protein
MPPSSPAHRLTGTFLLGLGLLSLAPFPILGPALGWPGSLGDPAALMLPKVLAHPSAVQFGYGLYVFYSLAFAAVPVCLLTLARKPLNTVATAAIACGVASSLARSVGILRWLSAMPDLAERQAKADPLTEAIIAIQYETINRWGGAIGEILGVGVFSGLAVGLTALALWRAPNIPRWISASGLIVALIQLSSLGTMTGLSGASVMITSTAINLWLMATGIALLIHKPSLDVLPTVEQRK